MAQSEELSETLFVTFFLNIACFNIHEQFIQLATFTFAAPIFLKGKLVAPKKGRCAQKASVGKKIHSKVHPFLRRTGRAHRALRWAPLHRNRPVRGEKKRLPARPQK
jgi:hypothetical protein